MLKPRSIVNVLWCALLASGGCTDLCESQPPSFEVELVVGDAKSFVMEIRTPPDAALSFHEITRASLTGACPDP